MSVLQEPIILSGAGIGGLFTALCLEQRGLSSIILEKSDELSEVGAGIQIGANGAYLIRELGLEQAIQQYALCPEYGYMADGKSGKEICTIPLNRFAQKKYQLPYYQIHRADLLKVLLDAVNQRLPDCIKLGQELVSIQQQTDGISVETRSGERFSGSLLVGCDGIHSQVRNLLFKDGDPVFADALAWRALIPLTSQNEQIADQVKVWVGEGKHLVQYPINVGEALNLVAVVDTEIPLPERWHGGVPNQEFQQAFDDWCPEVKKLVSCASDSLCWGLYSRPVLTKWSIGRATLLGDAAHAMLPSLAQGAVMAMEDGYELAVCLVQNDNIEQALEHYEAARIKRSIRAQNAARKNHKVFHLHRKALTRLSLFVLRALEKIGRFLPGGKNLSLAERLIARRYYWLYGYKSASVPSETEASAGRPNSI